MITFSRIPGIAILMLTGINVVAAQESEVPAIRALLDSKSYADGENFTKAEKLCRNGLERQTGDVFLTLLLVESLVGQKRLDEVPEVLTPAIDAHPRASELILKRAIAFASLNETEKLLSDCRRLDQLGEGRGLVLAAQVFEAQGNAVSAVMCYSHLLQIYPEADDRAKWQFARSKYFTELRMFDWAELDVTASIKAEWEPLKVLLLGEIQARQQRWEEAEAALQQVFEKIDPDQHFIAELRRLRVLVDMDELDKVAFLVKQYDEKYTGTEKLKRADPIRHQLQDRLVLIEKQKQAAQQQNRLSGFETAEQSVADRQRMQQLKSSTKPDEVKELQRLLIRHAQFGMQSKELEYAKVMLTLLDDGKEKFQLTNAEGARKATVAAWVLIQENKYTSAFASARAATQMDDSFGDAWRMMGLAAYQMDDDADAVEHLGKAIAADPLNPMAYGLRALILTDLGKHEQAATDLQQAGELAPNNTWLAGIRAHFFKSVGQQTAALRNYCQATPGNNLDRCELLLEIGLAELAVQDAQQYRQKADDSETPRIAAIVARAAYKWFTQTIQYETGGPTAKQLLDVCLHAGELNSGDPEFASYTADALRFQGQYGLSSMWTERALYKRPDSAQLLYQLASLKLAEGDLEAAKAANAKMQAAQYQDDGSVMLRNEMAMIVAQAEDLSATLTRTKFRTETGNALQHLLATPADTARTFETVHARKLDEVYTRMRPQAAGVTPPDANTVLRLSCISTADLKSQDQTLFDFDQQLATMTPRLKDGHFWFKVKYTSKNEIFGKSFAYFVKLDDGWKVFPEPWSVDGR